MQKSELKELLSKLEEIISSARALEDQQQQAIAKVNPAFTKSAANLLHYLSLRNYDLRPLQDKLSSLGLSSLGRTESHVMPNLLAVQLQLQQLLSCASLEQILELPASFSNLSSLLKEHSKALLCPCKTRQSGSIMVTLDASMANDTTLVKNLLLAGMDCARINCAHDDATTWSQLAQTVRQAAAETGINCPIFMDLAGPKLRTGPLLEKPKLLQIKPKLDTSGSLSEPYRVWLVPDSTALPEEADTILPVDAEWLDQVAPGDKIKFKDVRGRKRTLQVQGRKGKCVLTYLHKNAYISTGTMLQLPKNKNQPSVPIGMLPTEAIELRLYRGDLLVLHANERPGEAKKLDKNGKLLAPAHISCTLPEVLADVSAGERVLLNDGKIEGLVLEASESELLVKITFAKDKGSRLKGNKSINFPDSKLKLHGLTDKDKQDLAFVAKHADVVNVSFVQTPGDIEALFIELRRLEALNLGVLLKIETKRAFHNLPQLILTLMQHYPAGIMIARGDLAVEVGWNRLAEVQEEMLWLCEAAQLPVVWATQVLETLAKKGRPSRAEITDAAMSQRAECVMLNKGPHILEAIRSLRDIMDRMEGHQFKKFSMLRNLQLVNVKL